MLCDIIVPTYQNSLSLAHTLRALFRQTIPAGWSVKLIISDDGSTDGTLNIARRLCSQSSWDSQFISSPHAGAAAARNRAINISRADIILLLGADIILRPNSLSRHLSFHQKNPAVSHAALGLVKWDPRLKPSPLMEWMMHGGSQNDYDALLGKNQADPRHFFYASHLSLKRKMLGKKPFAEKFHHYGWEDLDLGRRLASQKLQLYVLHKALGLHRHYYSAKDIFQRQQYAGRGLPIYQQNHPSIKLVAPLTSYRLAKHRLLGLAGVMPLASLAVSKINKKYSTPRFFSLVAAGHFWSGFNKKSKRYPAAFIPKK